MARDSIKFAISMSDCLVFCLCATSLSRAKFITVNSILMLHFINCFNVVDSIAKRVSYQRLRDLIQFSTIFPRIELRGIVFADRESKQKLP